MSIKRKQEVSKNLVKNAIVDQLLASEQASLNIDTLLKGVQKHELLKLIDAESGIRFKLASSQNTSIDWEED
ncbi:hypothetical protein M9Y10_000074 [Tritrichomonas musculus]|uniref:Uncharacterized protein n=1 Tax=Tritrichomonas musculus TaxID=1915356 RepID=A0ABR2L494_9EUKA